MRIIGVVVFKHVLICGWHHKIAKELNMPCAQGDLRQRPARSGTNDTAEMVDGLQNHRLRQSSAKLKVLTPQTVLVLQSKTRVV